MKKAAENCSLFLCSAEGLGRDQDRGAPLSTVIQGRSADNRKALLCADFFPPPTVILV